MPRHNLIVIAVVVGLFARFGRFDFQLEQRDELDGAGRWHHLPRTGRCGHRDDPGSSNSAFVVTFDVLSATLSSLTIEGGERWVA